MVVAAIETNVGATIDRYGRHVVSDRNPDLVAMAGAMVMRDRLAALLIGRVAGRSVKNALFETWSLEAGCPLQTRRRGLSADDERQRQQSTDKDDEESTHPVRP